MALLSLQGVTLNLGGKTLLDTADLHVEQGERVCLVGRNGVGKSSLMALLSSDLTPDGGTITTRITTEPGWVTVSISDTGIGMPGEVQKHIFEKFYQGDASHSTYGTGLGLALAKRITDLHGGSISVRSAPGEGSCFSVRLPVQPASRRLCVKSGQS